ncbi:hypothetical protein TTHERM_00498160 (macronuclear) [Tetrahymena thermophila SB210]|uniref:Uncharacterized protein n=1 Tax=Tetrahymena thermophila (strain SB210) TaxID=312017 RepID=I7MK31_TETTS|nr:hypothetical protein TTHERM_00498160 [Tetrahymena thermophila SB210]EAS07762.2 hypothetical protein TTHERM_00498160 [Tetrahymena thermophila SB210]|eukprot:XP_001028004.2 hypothetical protein TTHERM_00498160 [Tetrahymena thermophila SB210]
MASNLIYNTPKYYQGPQSSQNSPRSTTDRSHSLNHSSNLYLTATSFNANNLIHNVAIMDMYDTSYNKSMKITDQRYLYKKAENEAQLLYNRIRFINQEEQKTLKKINDTQKKASEILSFRERNIKTSEERKRRKQEYEEQVVQKHQQVQEVKDISKIAKQLINESIQHKVQQEAQQLKQSKIKYKEYINRVSEDLFQQKLSKTNSIKSQEREAEYRKEKIQELKVQRAKGNYSKKLHQEVQKREIKEFEVQQLEKQEMKMVQNLKNTQTLQTKAMKDFEDILIQARNTSPSQQLSLSKNLQQYYSPSSPHRNTAKGIRKHHYYAVNNSVLVERLHKQSPSVDKSHRGNSQNANHVNLQINAFSYNPISEGTTPNSNRRVIDALKGQDKQSSSRRSSAQNSPAFHEISTDGSKNQ